MSKTNGINVLLGKEHIVLNAELAFSVQKNPAHLALIIEQLILDQLREYGAATLLSGNYRMSMTLCASVSNNVVDEEPDEEAVEETEEAEEESDEVQSAEDK